MNDLISVIVPIYNVEDYLSYCIDSLISQSYTNLEIILINDGSTDSSESICKKYVEKDKRIFYFWKENGGVSSARNLGLTVSKGKYILFVDSDDYIGYSHIYILYSAIKEYNADLSIGGYSKVSSYTDTSNNIKNKPMNLSYSRLDNKNTLEKMLVNRGFGWEPVAKLFSKKLINNIRFNIKEKIGEDFSFMYKVLSNINYAVVVSSKNYFYVDRLGSVTKSGYSLHYDKLLLIAEEFKDFVGKSFPKEKWMIGFFYIHSAIEILERLVKVDIRDMKKEKFYLRIIKKYYFDILLSKKVPFKFKVKVSIFLINIPFYLKIKSLIY